MDESKIILTLNKKDHSLAVHLEVPNINWGMSCVKQAIRQVKDFHPNYMVSDYNSVKIELSVDLEFHSVIPISDGCPNEDWYLATLYQALESLQQESRYAFAMMKHIQAQEQVKAQQQIDGVMKSLNRKN